MKNKKIKKRTFKVVQASKQFNIGKDIIINFNVYQCLGAINGWNIYEELCLDQSVKEEEEEEEEEEETIKTETEQTKN